MIFYKQFFIYKNKWVQSLGAPLLRLFGLLAIVCSTIVVVSLIYYVGFPVDDDTRSHLSYFYRVAKYIYIGYFLLAYLLEYRKKRKSSRIWFWVLTSLLYISVIFDMLPAPERGSFMRIFYDFFGNYYYYLSVLSLFSILILSSGVIRLLGKQTNPSFIIGISFLIIIIVGALLLKMPHCTYQSGISWLDSFFIATSSVCVTGLTSVDVSTTFTHTGWAVILLLIQIGGIGLMTLTSFFALFFMGNTSIYNQLVIKDLISSNAIGISLRKTLGAVILFTMTIEIVGAVLIWQSIHGNLSMTLKEELIFSVFHSVSAFCNAGFSTVTGNLGNPLLLNGHSWFYVVISFLVILGGLGFPILVNIKESLRYYLKSTYYKLIKKPHKQLYLKHLYALNSKIVLSMTVVLVIGGTLLFAVIEWNNSLSAFGFFDKIVQSFFNAVIPRTAGFMSVDIMQFQIPTILIITFLMWIGGGAQSTAGGIKVGTLAVSLVNLRAVLRNSQEPKIFRRNITQDSIRRANATIIISLILIALAVFTMTFTDSALSLRQIVFECVSALGTVGSSLNATMLLSVHGKIIIMCLMFLGRVGFITLVMGILKSKSDVYHYPSESIIIN